MSRTKYLLFITAFLALCFLPSYVHSQEEMDFEEFMGMMSETFTDEQLDELSYLLPWDIKVLGYTYGDYSEDGRIDVVLAIKELNVTPAHTLDVYFFENLDNKTYKLVKKKSLRWVEVPIEIAFLSKDGFCYITNRDHSNWYFTSYKISDDNVVQVNREVFPIIGVEKAGDN